MATKDKTVWLVEYVGAKPVPVYAMGTSVGFTCDAYAAKHFETKEEAEAWMVRPTVIPFESPWAAIEHCFFGFGHVDS